MDILLPLGISVAAIASLAWLARAITTRLLDTIVQKHESELDRQLENHKLILDKQLEEHRSELAFDYLRHSRAYDRRMEKVAELYGLLVALQNKMKDLTAFLRVDTGEPFAETKQRDMEAALDAYKKFVDAYESNRLLLPRDTCTMIDDINEDYFEAYRVGTIDIRLGSSDSNRTLDMMKQASDTVREKMPEMISQLEDDFRRLIGAVDRYIDSAIEQASLANTSDSSLAERSHLDE